LIDSAFLKVVVWYRTSEDCLFLVMPVIYPSEITAHSSGEALLESIVKNMVCSCRLRRISSRHLLICALVAAAISLLAVLVPSPAAAQAPCPSPIPVPIPPPNLAAPAATMVPDDVCIPTSFPGNPIAYFDDYSWRAFIALVWPRLNGQRGVPDPNLPITTVGTPLVFETYKADWETFQPNGTPPSAFNDNTSYWTSNPSQSPCPLAKPGDFLLAPVAKFGNVGLAGVGDLVSVLIAQNGTFVRYIAAYNQIEFNQILQNQLYLAANLPQNKNPTGPSIVFQSGSLDIKSAWIDMTNVPNPQRYYSRLAWLLDPISSQCSQTPVSVGLVGLHIVQKTPSRPQWIWSTFEQIDNVPQPGYVPPNPPAPPSHVFTFNNGTATPMPGSPPADFIWSNARNATTAPSPVNIQRLKPINSSTANTNGIWQSALKARNSVWQFYQLTMTQWPVPGDAPANPGSPNFTFPGTGATSAFSNTALETWDQNNIRTGCMNCHTAVQNNDFLWSLQMNAFSPPQISFAPRPQSPAVKELRSLLREQFQ
jgi:hypothetical protein